MIRRLGLCLAAAALLLTLSPPPASSQQQEEELRIARLRQEDAARQAASAVNNDWTMVRTVTGRLEPSEREDVALRLLVSPHRQRVLQYRFSVEHTPTNPFLKTFVRGPEGDIAVSEGRDGWVETSVGIPTRGRSQVYEVVVTRVARNNRRAFNYTIVVEQREVGQEEENTEPPPPPPPPPGLWSRSGSGPTVFSKPVSITRVFIRSTYTGSAENFVVWCRGPGRDDLIVNEIVGTSFGNAGTSGIYLMPSCGTVQIEYSQGVSWFFEERR